MQVNHILTNFNIYTIVITNYGGYINMISEIVLVVAIATIMFFGIM